VTSLILSVIIEGQGENASIEQLIQRIVHANFTGVYVRVIATRMMRGKLHNLQELERFAEIAKVDVAGRLGGVILLMDADKDCPATLSRQHLDKFRAILTPYPAAMVFAKYEYENWFLAAAKSIGGKCGLQADLKIPDNPEKEDAEEWLNLHMIENTKYKKPLHQPELTKAFDLKMAHDNSPSFRKFVRDVVRVVNEAMA
jgi:hypothetical protein